MKINFDFTFRQYNIIKTYKILNNKFLIITTNGNTKKLVSVKENILNSIFYQNKITNKAFIQLFKKSVFKKFKNIINGQIFFVTPRNNKEKLKKTKYAINKKNLSLANSLAFKLNNKMYSPKKILISNFLTYKENIILLFQLNTIGIKSFLKF